MDLKKLLDTKTPFVFAKFGDGEHLAALKSEGHNCDGTPYTDKLGDAVKNALLTLVEYPNSWIGKWEDDKQVVEQWNTISDKIQWEDYHYFIFKNMPNFHKVKKQRLLLIRNAKVKKIYVCNESMVEIARQLLQIDEFVTVHKSNWYETSQNETLNTVVSLVQPDESCLILTSAGMGAKPLLADLRKLLSQAMLIDLGSCLDQVCLQKITRSFHHDFCVNDLVAIKSALSV